MSLKSACRRRTDISALRALRQQIHRSDASVPAACRRKFAARDFHRVRRPLAEAPVRAPLREFCEHARVLPVDLPDASDGQVTAKIFFLLEQGNKRLDRPARCRLQAGQLFACILRRHPDDSRPARLWKKADLFCAQLDRRNAGANFPQRQFQRLHLIGRHIAEKSQRKMHLLTARPAYTTFRQARFQVLLQFPQFLRDRRRHRQGNEHAPGFNSRSRFGLYFQRAATTLYNFQSAIALFPHDHPNCGATPESRFHRQYASRRFGRFSTAAPRPGRTSPYLQSGGEKSRWQCPHTPAHGPRDNSVSTSSRGSWFTPSQKSRINRTSMARSRTLEGLMRKALAPH